MFYTCTYDFGGSFVYSVMKVWTLWDKDVATVDGESFAGLNFHGFDPMKYFAEILSRFIGHKCLCYIDN